MPKRGGEAALDQTELRLTKLAKLDCKMEVVTQYTLLGHQNRNQNNQTINLD